MSDFHNTHYNLIDVLISYRPDVWQAACHKVTANHNNPSAIVREHSNVAVVELTDLLLKDIEANNWQVKIQRPQLSVFVECALWSFYHMGGTAWYRFDYPSPITPDEPIPLVKRTTHAL